MACIRRYQPKGFFKSALHDVETDLLVFIQDMVGRISEEQWLPSAQAFLEGYGRPEIVARLRKKLVVPSGLSRVWWAVRTTYLNSRELQRRVAALRERI